MAQNAGGAAQSDTLLLRKLFTYASTVDTSHIVPTPIYTYQKAVLDVSRRNFLLMAVPSMFRVARSPRRKFISEVFSEVDFRDIHHFEAKPLCSISTFPRRSMAMPELLQYLTPNLYSVTIFGERLLSPFHRLNKKYYRYRIYYVRDGKVRIKFKPKIANTQLIEGVAVIDSVTGRVVSADFSGEYDMLRFRLKLNMGRKGVRSLFPTTILLNGSFSLLGNRIKGEYLTHYDLPLPDSIAYGSRSPGFMTLLRPDTLATCEQQLYEEVFNVKRDTTVVKAPKKRNWMWDVVGERALNRMKGTFGAEDQGSYRVSPLFNPLYFGYSSHRGVTYRLDLRGNWRFTPNHEIAARMKLGYSFQQDLVYYKIPVLYTFDRKHNGFFRAEVSNGNRITNSEVMEEVKHERGDSIDWNKYKLDLFKDFRFQTTLHYEPSPRLGLECGTIMHRRSAVNKSSFRAMGRPTSYKSVAPFFELEYRPSGYSGPILTLDYEQSIKGLLGSTMRYSRWEADGQYILRLQQLRSLSMRAGAGFYASKGKSSYFLDYSNFREDNIPGGWNDDWSGQFELLNSNWYNASSYYVRANLTYESPLLLAAWIPFAGHFIEMERLYVSALNVTHLHSYLELGYGFTTRLFSIGAFVANRNGKFDGAGCRFGFELFKDW